MPYLRTNNEMPIIPGYASGDIVTISDALTASPVNTLTASVSGSGCNVIRTGANAWDEEWELGSYDSNGNKVDSTTTIRSKNLFPILPTTTYYYYNGSGVVAGARFYDVNGLFLSSLTMSANRTFNTPANAYYMSFVILSAYGTTYNHDISINYPSTDTSYHAYIGTIYPITFPSSVSSGSITINSDGSVDLTSEGTTSRLTATAKVTINPGLNNIWVDTGDIENLVYIRRSGT